MKVTLTIKPTHLAKKLNFARIIANDAVDQWLPRALLLIHGDTVKSINNLSSGSKSQIRYSPKRKVQVSRPGKPPNTDLGDLVRSIQWKYNKSKNEGIVGSNLKKAAWLELGTKTIKPRPFLGPAVKKNKKKIPKGFVSELKSEIKKAGKK